MNRSTKIIAIFLITLVILPLHARDLQCDLIKPDQGMLSQALQKLVKAKQCKRLLALEKRGKKQAQRGIHRARKRCNVQKLNTVISKTVYKPFPVLEPGVTDLVTPAGRAMAVAWCQCRTGRYDKALKTLERTAVFGWDAKILPAYAYVLGTLRSAKQALELLQLVCPSDRKCMKIREILQSKEGK